ncbi:MAG: polyamine aminopropyltransferase, partial [Pseudomonadota bacterium]
PFSECTIQLPSGFCVTPVTSKKPRAQTKAAAKKTDPSVDPTSDRWVSETFHEHWRVALRASKVLFESETEHQHLIIFENPTWGRVLMLDGVVQLSTRDEFVYHEMMAHVPLMAHRLPKRVLIIGGGDGGVLREVLKHDCVESAELVEIDQSVIDLAVAHFPTVSAGAFDDPRVSVRICDGAEHIAAHTDHYDVIIVDSSEPIGPSAVLHAPEFFADCRAALRKKGMLVAQTGLPFLFPEQLRHTTQAFRDLFKTAAPYLCHQPCYFGGPFAMCLGSQSKRNRKLDVKDLKGIAADRGIKDLKYWTPGVHRGAFALPAELQCTVHG